jgi:hypothetical protein
LRKTCNLEVDKENNELVNMGKPLPIVVFGGSILKVTGCRTMPKANQREVFMRITTCKVRCTLLII